MKRTDIFGALQALKNGEVIIYPTDTLYALGADISNESAVRRVFTIKKRPLSCPLPVAVATIEDVKSIAHVNDISLKIMKHFFPGTLTVILKKKPKISATVTSGRDNIAVRIPNNTTALKLLSLFGPLTVTSANLHSEKTPHVIKDILMQLHTDFTVCLDEGRLDAKPSTIVDLTTAEPTITRKGTITKKQILEVLTNE